MLVADLLVGGILLGGVYALMACGLNLIFGVMRVINFAHGDVLAIAALSTVSIAVGLKLPFWVAVLVVPIGCAVFGALIHLLILRRIEGAPLIMSLLATYALSTILVNVAILIWGGGYSGLPGVLSGSIRIFNINVSISRLGERVERPQQLGSQTAPAAPGYQIAIRLARGGASPEELISGCGLSTHEAELVHRRQAGRHRSPGPGALLRQADECAHDGDSLQSRDLHLPRRGRRTGD